MRPEGLWLQTSVCFKGGIRSRNTELGIMTYDTLTDLVSLDSDCLSFLLHIVPHKGPREARGSLNSLLRIASCHFLTRRSPAHPKCRPHHQDPHLPLLQARSQSSNTNPPRLPRQRLRNDPISPPHRHIDRVHRPRCPIPSCARTFSCQRCRVNNQICPRPTEYNATFRSSSSRAQQCANLGA